MQTVEVTMKIQIDDIIRDATPAEKADIEAVQQQSIAAGEAHAAARASALAKLAALGLTEAEIAALLGA